MNRLSFANRVFVDRSGESRHRPGMRATPFYRWTTVVCRIYLVVYVLFFSGVVSRLARALVVPTIGILLGVVDRLSLMACTCIDFARFST